MQNFAVTLSQVVPSWLSTFYNRFPGFGARYLTLHTRSLGVARVYLGLLLLADLLRRTPHLSAFYTNRGVLPNHMLLWHPVAHYQFSLFFLASHRGEAVLLFVLCAGVFALFTLGYRTRLMHLLSLVAICSLHGRLAFMDDGSETTTRLLTFWTLFLPMGARYSLDSVRRQAGGAAAEGDAVAISLVVPAILLQIALLYVFNVLHKNGATWHEGTAVHYVLHQNKAVTWLGWKLRPHITPALSRALTYTTVVVESLIPTLLLSPIATRITRRMAFVLAFGLHAGFALLLNLGMFSFNMVGFLLLFLSGTEHAWIAQRMPGVFAKRVQLWARQLVHALGLELRQPMAASPLRARLIASLPSLREGVVVLFALALGSQMLLENAAVPGWARVIHQPQLFRMLVEYPRFYEGWSMFAPEAPLQDNYMFVDAVTLDGRHVDPLNQAASREAKLPVSTIPEWLDQDDLWSDYISNVVGVREYQPALAQFIRDYPRRTKRPEDGIKSFKVWLLEDDSPPPAEDVPRNTRRTLIFKE